MCAEAAAGRSRRNRVRAAEPRRGAGRESRRHRERLGDERGNRCRGCHGGWGSYGGWGSRRSHRCRRGGVQGRGPAGAVPPAQVRVSRWVRVPAWLWCDRRRSHRLAHGVPFGRSVCIDRPTGVLDRDEGSTGRPGTGKATVGKRGWGRPRRCLTWPSVADLRPRTSRSSLRSTCLDTTGGANPGGRRPGQGSRQASRQASRQTEDPATGGAGPSAVHATPGTTSGTPRGGCCQTDRATRSAVRRSHSGGSAAWYTLSSSSMLSRNKR